ncbi:hypothetical protein WN943_015161 [Citrus x changshan-huyou]
MSPSSGINSNGGANGWNYIEHQVSKMDTLAGVAIKYGVEVADIKRLNGLATDLQMFALKTLHIPLPGRHPPSPSLSDGSSSSGYIYSTLMSLFFVLAYFFESLNLYQFLSGEATTRKGSDVIHYWGCGCNKGENLNVLEGFRDTASSVPNQIFAVARPEVTADVIAFCLNCYLWSSNLLLTVEIFDFRENSMERTPPRLGYSNILQSLESLRTESSKKGSLATGTSQKVSSAMSNLQKYYGLRSPNGKGKDEGTEMAVYRTGSSGHFDNGLFPKASPVSHPFASLIHKSKSLVNGFLHENGATDDYVPLAEAGEGEGEKSNEKSVRRRQKAEADSRVGTPERLLKEENSGGSSGFSPATGKGLAMRPKSASRTSTSDSESGWLSSIPVGLGDSIMTDGPVGVRKSSSTPSFIDQDSSSSSIWPTSKWSLKPDLQALSTVAITRPIFDGLPKPSRRGKAALD